MCILDCLEKIIFTVLSALVTLFTGICIALLFIKANSAIPVVAGPCGGGCWGVSGPLPIGLFINGIFVEAILWYKEVSDKRHIFI